MRKSIWSEYLEENKDLSKLNQDLNVDVLIIGGGITGLSVANNLINKNLTVALVEKNNLFAAVTSRTTAKITYLQEDIYTKLKFYFNEFISKQYLDSQKEAIEILTSTIKNNNIDCDLEQVKSYVFADKKENKLKKEKNLLKKLGINVKTCNKLPEKLNVKEAIYVDDTYVFNPIKYLNSLKNLCLNNNINIYINTKVLKIKKGNDCFHCYTKSNKITAKYVVLAVHFPYFLFPYLMPLKVTLEKSYIRALKCKENFGYSAINIEKPIKSIRFYEKNNAIYKIQLTNSHNIAIKNNEKKNFESFDYGNENIEYMWSNIDIMTNDKLPFIGEIEKNLLIGTGYNAWGMTNSTIAGKIISDIILKNDNEYIKLFNPKRNLNLGKIINFPISLSSNAYSYIKNKIKTNKSWYQSIRFEKRNNKKVAIYTDENNNEHIVYNLCPHLKCSLIFNEVELTWDCPCHGSRFDIDGNCIEGPSNYDIRIKKTD